MFGPVGPLKNADWSSPQRPSNAIHGNADSAAFWSPGIVTTFGVSSVWGPRVSSQPTPASAELPSQSAALYLLACEPAAGYVTGCVPPTTSSLSSPHDARSAPSCTLYPTSAGFRPSASEASRASKTSWIISQSPSWVLLKSLKG